MEDSFKKSKKFYLDFIFNGFLKYIRSDIKYVLLTNII